MIKCPACSHENVDGTMFCEMCGEDMQAGDSAAAPTSGSASTPATASTGEVKCPACDNMNPADNVVCEICGTELRPADNSAVVPAAPAAPSTPIPSTPTPAAALIDTVSTPVVPSSVPAPDLADVAAPSTTPFDAALNDVAAAAAPDVAPITSAPLVPGKVKLVVEQGMTIGKQFVLSDAETQVGREDADEDIYPDIDLADQDEGYVHRKHATLKFEGDQLMVTHLGGANKTRINNKPIPDNTPQAAQLGDKIAFGKVVLRLIAL